MAATSQESVDGILSTLNSPADLKKIAPEKLPLLASEIRARIHDVVARTGGHLGGPLGVVELSIALHYLYNAPEDKIVWDTGHQSYPHKLLTGRNAIFDTLRQQGGISGFCNIFESDYDAFGAGHAGTALSAALGMAIARDLKHETNKVIAIVGDGALTAGLSYEALNNIGYLKPSMLVILNDNGMSISPNVGALSHYLANTAIHVRNGVLFEHLGFQYYGPIDGHDINSLLSTLKEIKDIQGPVLLHIKTNKGHGCQFPHSDEEKVHGMSPFDKKTGKTIAQPQAITYTQAFAESLMKIAESDRKIVAITAAMKSGTGLKAFAQRFPERFFDVGIAEQHAVTFAAGLAINGMHPVCAIYSTFLQRSLDQVIHDVCIQNLPVTFALDRAGLVGDDGPTHNGPFDIAYLRMVPNMTVMVPKDENELQDMLYTATQLPSPASVRYPRGAGRGVQRSIQPRRIPIGTAEVVQKGENVLILTVGPAVYDAQEAAKESGINATIINARFVKPLDEDTIITLAHTHQSIITVEEGSIAGGFGSAISELLQKHGVQKQVRMLGIPDRFIDHAKQAQQKAIAGIDKEAIKRALIEAQ